MRTVPPPVSLIVFGLEHNLYILASLFFIGSLWRVLATRNPTRRETAMVACACRQGWLGLEWRCLTPPLAFVVLFHLAVAGILARGGLPVCYWPYGQFALLAILLTCVLGGAASVLGSQIVRDMRDQAHGLKPTPFGERLASLGKLVVGGWVLALIYAAVLLAYVNLKPAIAVLNPVTCDPQLESWERALFGGVLPTEWLVAHSSRAALYVWEFIYGLFWPMLFVSMMIALHHRGLRGGARLVLALSIGLLLDAMMTLAYPTRGPIFVHPEWFAGLEGLPSGEWAAFLTLTVQCYTAEPGTVYAFSGISAMPSYHVFGWICALLCWSRLPRGVVVFGWGLALLNWVSSVVLGWHYALDGVVGIALALCLWWLTGRLMFKGASPTCGRSRAGSHPR